MTDHKAETREWSDNAIAALYLSGQLTDKVLAEIESSRRKTGDDQ